MKIWMSLPEDMKSQESEYNRYVGIISTAATCPPRTMEMVHDKRFWYEAEITRRMDVPTLERFYGMMR
jgi:hypothetical protein